MGLGDFLKGAGKAVSNVAHAADWVTDPTHFDDIARGVGKGASYVEHHPGKVWDTGFEAGRSMLKDQLKPQNLALTAGLVALSVATGGAATPLLAGELAEGAVAGAEGAKAISAGVAATKGVEAGVSAAKGAATAADVVKGAEAAGSAVKGAEAVGTASRASRLLEGAGKVLDAPAQLKGSVREAVGLSRYGKVAETRAALGSRVLGNAAEETGAKAFAQRAAADVVSGGASNFAYEGPVSDFAQAKHRIDQVRGLPGQAHQIGHDVEVAADPTKVVRQRAMAELDKRGVGQSTGYNDPGQTAEDVYSYANPNAAKRGTDAYSAMGSGGGGDGEGPTLFSPSAEGPTPRQSAFAGGAGEQTPSSRYRTVSTHRSPQMHMWEGPSSQAFGGIKAGYNWRSIDPLRPISVPGLSRQRVRGSSGGEAQGDLNEQGAPSNFSPEVPKGGNYAMSTGQQPLGALNPGQPSLSAGPNVRVGEAAQSHMYATDARPRQQPMGAVGAGPVKSSVIDAHSWSDDDYGTDKGGQGYFNFGSVGGTTGIGPQPPYRAGSRTSNRGMLGI